MYKLTVCRLSSSRHHMLYQSGMMQILGINNEIRTFIYKSSISANTNSGDPLYLIMYYFENTINMCLPNTNYKLK